MRESTYHRGVRDQYEDYPYPPRDPREELERLRQTSLDQLALVNHYCFAGRGAFENMQVLVAGGGTGDATIYLAEQLRHTAARITYLDVSKASMRIAKDRARVRKLGNIDWVHGSLLDLPEMGLGTFDYINCTGVLHHLEDPLAGLRALKAVLSEHGAMGLMVYGKYGRTGIYQIQDLMKMINQGEPDVRARLRNTRSVLASLPRSNWFKRSEELASDLSFGDAGLYDLFLHAQDRAFSIPELYALLRAAGMNFACFTFEKIRYEPGQYISDKALLRRISALPEPEQQAIAELVCGNIMKHTFYCARGERPPPKITDDDMVPFLWGANMTHEEAFRTLERNPTKPLEFVSLYLNIEFRPSVHTAPVFKFMNGDRSVAEIVERVAAETQSGDTDPIRDEIRAIYAALNPLNLMFLRHQSVARFAPEPHQASPADP